MIIVVVIIGWIACSALAYILFKRSFIKSWKEYVSLSPVWTKGDRSACLVLSSLGGPFSFMAAVVIIVADFLANVRLSNPDEPAKW